jgi:hypothetical protein
MPEPGVQSYDREHETFDFHCPHCDETHTYPIRHVPINAHILEDRSTWGMVIGKCPGCAKRGKTVEHHLNLNLPDDHPHASAKPINQMLRHRHGDKLPDANRK